MTCAAEILWKLAGPFLSLTVMASTLLAQEAPEMPSNTSPLTLQTALQKTKLDGGYVAPLPEQTEQAERLFARLLAGEISDELDAALAELGFERIVVSLGSELLTMVQEAPGRREGKGVFVVRAEGKPVLLEAPHRFNDLYTGAIVTTLFAQSGARAAAWSTTARWYYDESGERIDADLAHLKTSYFNAFSVAFARANAEYGRIIQIHGFDTANRNSAAGARAGAILSSGTSSPGAITRQIAGCLAPDFPPYLVMLFPDDVDELGATTNSTAAALRSVGFSGFVHIELSRDLRMHLSQTPEFTARMARCLPPP